MASLSVTRISLGLSLISQPDRDWHANTIPPRMRGGCAAHSELFEVRYTEFGPLLPVTVDSVFTATGNIRETGGFLNMLDSSHGYALKFSGQRVIACAKLYLLGAGIV